jgi:hypothetical protein
LWLAMPIVGACGAASAELRKPCPPATMTAAQIRAALEAQLAQIPEYPEDDNGAALREYDDSLNIALEGLRDLCQEIVALT